MSVDKFGRHSASVRLDSQKGPKGDGFKLTAEGDYDIDNKRLRFVRDPEENTDAVNLKTLTSGLVNAITLQDDVFDAQGKQIVNLDNPTNHSHAVNLSHLLNSTPIKNLDNYSVHQYRVQDVAAPQYDGDAVNLVYVQNHALLKDENNVFNAKNTTITNVAPPTSSGDAVNRAFVENIMPTKNNQEWNFKNKRLTGVNNPTTDLDAVNRRYFRDNSITKHGTNAWYAKLRTLKGLGAPEDMDDAVTKRYLLDAMTEFAYVLYTRLHFDRSTLMTKENWKAKASTSTWEELFN